MGASLVSQASNESFPIARVAFEGRGTEAAETFMPRQSWWGVGWGYFFSQDTALMKVSRWLQAWTCISSLELEMQFPLLPEQTVCLSAVCLLVLLYTSQSVQGSLGDSTYFAQDESEVQIGKGLDVTMHTGQAGDQAGLQTRLPSSSLQKLRGVQGLLSITQQIST